MQLAFVLYKYFPFGGLQRDFMTQVADRIDPLMQPPESTWAQFFAHAEGRRARLDATLRRILDADTQGPLFIQTVGHARHQ